jgi:thiol-disulfide isomerase/thioredoxin
MNRVFAAALLLGAVLSAQTDPREQQDLERALSEAGSSPAEYLRAIEKHLQKYPDTARKEELERAAVRAAMEANDDGRIVLYGERVLARRPDDLQILERVARSLLADDGKEASARAMKYARRYEELARRMQSERPRDAEWIDQTDRGIGRALCYQARAAANLGHSSEALALAQRAFETYPTAEAARETSHGFELLGQFGDAARALADAFTIQDPRTSDSDRARDRVRMGELYRKAKGSEAGLGDLVLHEYDRNLALVRARALRMRANDPNALLTDPMQFTITALEGAKLQMATLKGKIVVFDFWATWCVPCRAQHPLYDAVKKRFAGNANVVFLSIDTDEDHSLVRPFLDELKWKDAVYFEDGLSRAMKITSIPTTIVIDRRGQLFTRMNGYTPERFVEQLTAKIEEALGN